MLSNFSLSDNARENRAKARIGDIFDLDGPIMDGTHYPRYLQGQVGLVLILSFKQKNVVKIC